MRRLRLILTLIGAAITLLAILLPAFASATPVSEKKAEARQIRQQVAALDEKLEAVIEEYNYANEEARNCARRGCHIVGNVRMTTRLLALLDSCRLDVDTISLFCRLGILGRKALRCCSKHRFGYLAQQTFGAPLIPLVVT